MVEKSTDQIDLLKLEKLKQEFESYQKNQINWLTDDYWNDWDLIKAHMKKMWGHKEQYLEESPKWFFLAHSKDAIKGKPQLVDNVQKTIPLIRLVVNKTKDKETKEDIDIQSFFFFDERYDKRYDGYQVEAFSKDFFMYRVIDDSKNQYFVLSEKELPNQTCTFNGMLIELDDFAEMSRNLKLKSVSKLFILKDYEQDVKILSKAEIVNYTKTKGIDELDWRLFLNYHQNGTINLFPIETEYLRSAKILCGKYDGYTLHVGTLGPAGTKKSWGELETLNYKFYENNIIIGGGNTRAKALVPSFKESIADIGYFAKADRIGLVDEWGKMAEFEMNKHQTTILNLFGEWNDLLDHKFRKVGSGNSNGCDIQANAKFFFTSNPISNRPTISSHVGLLDNTTMSRILWWVQDEAEQKFLRSPESILRSSPYTYTSPNEAFPSSPHTFTSIYNDIVIIENRKKDIVLKKCWGKVGSREEFLTLFDTCYSFVSEMEDSEVLRLVNIVSSQAEEPMKSSVWLPRAEHHVRLLIDGICKHRCLFVDYDTSFVAKQKDYDLVERILIRMVRGWRTNLAPKEEFR